MFLLFIAAFFAITSSAVHERDMNDIHKELASQEQLASRAHVRSEMNAVAIDRLEKKLSHKVSTKKHIKHSRIARKSSHKVHGAKCFVSPIKD